MKSKKTPLIMITLVLMGTLTLALQTQQVEADSLGIIRIEADGSVEGTTKIQRDGDVYTFTDHIYYKSIWIEKDGITLDGANYRLVGVSSRIGRGINLTGRTRVMVKNVRIRKFYWGVRLDSCSSCQVYHNLIVDGNNDKYTSSVGIYLQNSNHNTLYNNTVQTHHGGIYLIDSNDNRILNCTAENNGDEGNGSGIWLDHSSDNDVCDNEASINHDGIILRNSSQHNRVLYNTVRENGAYPMFGLGIEVRIASSYNTIKQNNFIYNAAQVRETDSYYNAWNGSYPSGGNHWSDYTGEDNYSGPNQDQPGSDGIVDEPYPIPPNEIHNDSLPWKGKLNYTYVHLTIEAEEGGTTGPIPGTYPYVKDGEARVTAYPDSGYQFHYWILNGTYYYNNPITVTMDSDHTLEAHFRKKSGGGCPILFVWNGTVYSEEGVLNIHAEFDVTVQHEIEQTPVPKNHFYSLQLRELDEHTSHIDQVKLYAVDNEGEWHLCPLIHAKHSELGKVTRKLRLDDEKRIDLKPTETIDLKFLPSIPHSETEHFIFEINGYNAKQP